MTNDDYPVDDGDRDTDGVNCTVCGATVGRGPGGLGTAQHANKHRREFQERYHREPDDYQEVREKLGGNHPSGDHNQLSLLEAVDERAREHRTDNQQQPLNGGTDQ